MNKLATILILDELNIAILGLETQQYTYFWERFGIHTKGYFFNPQYKMGRWDGKIRFFGKSGKTSINLLPEILPILKSAGYKFKIKDNRSPAEFDLPIIDADYFTEFGITLQDHQVDGINAVTENNGGISVLATGAGKAIMIAVLCDLYEKQGLNSIVIVPSIDLVSQTADEIKQFGLSVGLYCGANKDLNKRHVVSTWQSLQNSPQVLSMFKCIIVDECHGTGSANNVLRKLIMEHGHSSVVRIGLTGTLPKEPAEAMGVRCALGDVVYEKPAHELITSGWLADLHLTCYTLEEDFTERWEYLKLNDPEAAAKLTYKKFKNTYFPDYASERAFITTNKKRNATIGKMIESATELHGNSFILVSGIAFGKRLAKLIPNAIFVYGADATEVRKKVYGLFAENDNVIVISTYQLASTGLNIKRIFNLFLIDPNKSFIQIIQSIGRGLRKAHDKDRVNLYDISSDLKYSKKHSTQRKAYYDEQQYAYINKVLNYSALDI